MNFPIQLSPVFSCLRAVRTLRSRWILIVAGLMFSGCDFLKIQEESTSPAPAPAPTQQTQAAPAPPPPPPPPVVPPEKIAQQVIDEFYKLNSDQVTDQSLQKLASIYDPAKATIETLNLQGTKITDNSFESLKQFPNLKTLNLAFTHVTRASMANLTAFPNLEVVNLGHTNANNEVVEMLASIPTIRSVDLNETPVDDDVLAILDKFENLERLSIGGVGGVDGGGFRGARRLNRLKALVLNKTGIVDLAIPIISKYPLEELHMSGCYKLTDAGISKLSGMKELKYLNLRDNPGLSSRGLAKVATNPKLWALNLTNVPRFDDQGLKFFARSKTLKHIELSGTGVAERGKEALKKALPEIQFTMPY